MQDTWTRTVACRDSSGRERKVQVVITAEFNIALITPPGDSAVWHPGELPRLTEALTEAHLEAVARRMGRP